MLAVKSIFTLLFEFKLRISNYFNP